METGNPWEHRIAITTSLFLGRRDFLAQQRSDAVKARVEEERRRATVRPGERGNEEDGGLTCACKKKIKG
jgi:hypothetical protein